MATRIGTTGILKPGEATPNFRGDGTWVQCMFGGQFGGGAVYLEMSRNNGTTFHRTGDKLSYDKGFSVNTYKTLYRFVFSDTQSGTVEYWVNRDSL